MSARVAPAKVADGEVRAEAGERKTGAAWVKLGSGSWYEAQLAVQAASGKNPRFNGRACHRERTRALYPEP